MGVPLLDVQVNFLVRRKFGGTLVRTRLIDGRRITSYVTARDRCLREEERYEAKLRTMPPEHLQALYEEEQARERVELQAKADREAQRFFNQPEAEADFEHWSKAADWTLDEAIALSFGKAPEVVSWEKVKEHVGGSRFATQYGKLRDLARLARRSQQLYDPVLPGFFLAWAKRNDIDYPAELEAQVVARGLQIADWKSLYDV